MNTVNIEQELRVESCEKFASTCNSQLYILRIHCPPPPFFLNDVLKRVQRLSPEHLL